ncbi:MAG TPA: 16S rRNA (uracil(1498)-N(3))-methyltransferase [Bacteroidetes bacterium]|nr:16S rRNA (uracil(1498)-N(3))-methyltransferase [Bacteroidota bacterium]
MSTLDFFYVIPQDVHGSTIVLRGDEYKHLARVLRKRIGEHILVTDGEDTMFEAVVSTLGRDEGECEIVQTHLRKNEPRISVTLGVSLLKNPSRFDVLVEKVTEFGVRSIVPLVCERTLARQDKHDRLEKITITAMKQSGRSYRPRIFPLTSFETLVSHSDEYELRLMPHERTEQSQFVGSVLQHHEGVKSVLVVVGPEGGFTDGELDIAAAHSFVPISLGPRRLRSETAAMSAVAWIVGAG